MTLTPRAPRVLLGWDAITIARKGATVDVSGNSTSAPVTVFTGRGTVFALTARDSVDAAVRKVVVDAGVALQADVDVRPDDRVVCARGTFVVVSVEDRRLYRRALIRKVN